jgi:hypothetical protein
MSKKRAADGPYRRLKETDLRKVVELPRLLGFFVLEPIGIHRRKACPLLGQILQSKNRRHGANGNARAAVDAFIRMNIELLFGLEARFVLARVNAIHRADIHAGSVFRSNARLRDYIRHFKFSSIERVSRSVLEASAGNPDARFLNNFYITIGERVQAPDV